MADDRCPVCKNGDVRRHEGKLDQSGFTYLPTVVWSCDVCGYARYEAVRDARWLPLAAVTATVWG